MDASSLVAGPALAFLLVAALLFAALLVLLAVLGRAASRAVAGPAGAAGGDERRRGCLASLALVAVLGFLGMLAASGLVALVLLATLVAFVEHNPVERIEVRRAPDSPWLRRADRPVRLAFDVRGDAGDPLVRLVEEVSGRDVVAVVRETTGADGATRTSFEFVLPVEARDLEELERELRSELPRLQADLPEGVTVDLRAVDAPATDPPGGR